MIAVSERRCDHGFMRSMVRCDACEAFDVAAARAKPIDAWQDPPTLALAPVTEPPAYSFSVSVPGVPYQAPPRGMVFRYLPQRHTVPSAPASLAIDPERVLQAVAAAYFISVAELCGKRRHQCVAHARLVAYWALRRLCNLSYPQIGRIIGGRDHTTAMAGVRKVEAKRLVDASFRDHTDRLLAGLGGVAI